MRFRDEALREVSGGLGMFRGVRLRGIVSDGVWEYILSEVGLGGGKYPFGLGEGSLEIIWDCGLVRYISSGTGAGLWSIRLY